VADVDDGRNKLDATNEFSQILKREMIWGLMYTVK
jgi:hypothetical protein